MLAAFVVDEVFAFLLVLVRVSAAFMLLPGIGDVYVSPRIRLLFALTVTLVVLPTLLDTLPAVPETILALAVLLVGEILIGLFIGVIARALLTALEVAGTVASMTTSLANAQVFNPAAAVQGSLVSGFFLVAALVLIFATDLHHLLLMAVIGSYRLFPPGEMPPINDMAQVVATLVADGFTVGVQLAAPFLVVALVVYTAMGLMSRLMPQMMIFFVALPAQIITGIGVLLVVFSSVMLVWLEYFQSSFLDLLG